MSALLDGFKSRPALANLLGVALLVVLGVGALSSRLNAQLLREAEPQSALRAESSIPPGWMLRFAALGHDEALADLLWINALSYFGKNLRVAKDDDWLDPHLEAISALDPRFVIVYEWAGTVLMYGGRIDRASIEASNRVLHRGTEQFPQAWSLWFMLGMNYVVEYPAVTTHPLEQILFKRLGARYLARASGLPNAPSQLRLTALRLLRQEGSWQIHVANTRETLLLAREGTEARTARVLLEQRLSPSLSLEYVAERELRLELTGDPRFRWRNGDFSYALHPDPAAAIAPARLRPPTLDRMR